ncbi:MAG: PEP-utilizing enzyme, partial [Acidimicrobiia bacterium]|nr:PEP-utilizing enzyme [Acidimicrobiia bacterium]
DVDRALLGGNDSNLPPHRPQKGDRNLLASLRGLRSAWRTLATTELPELDADRRRVARWLDTLPDPNTATDHDLRAQLESSNDLIYELFETHLIVSGGAAMAQGALTGICRDQLGDESLVLALTSGLGDVASAAPSEALWDLGRMVAESPPLVAAFDDGVDDGLADRLASAGDEGARFHERFQAFLAVHGCRGPNEWETACPTWGTDPLLALTLVDRMRGADPERDPRRQHDALRRRRLEATAEAEASLNRAQRWLFRRALRSAHIHSAARERSKTTVIEAIHGVRLLGRELGRRMAARSGGADDDLWFVLIDELDDYLSDPMPFAHVIAERRSTRELLATLEPPFVFDGEIPPIDQWRRRDHDGATPLTTGDELTGIGGSAGVARGRACVVLDPATPGDLGPGDVLVAPSTDPAWTPLFVPAEAVVVDVGAQMSHAVIVSRELGLPCVVSATDATHRIPHGATIEVDGDAGVVRIIEADPSSTSPGGAS